MGLRDVCAYEWEIGNDLGSCNSPPTSAEVKKTWIYTSTPLYAFMA
jgi:hypothetical protein